MIDWTLILHLLAIVLGTVNVNYSIIDNKPILTTVHIGVTLIVCAFIVIGWGNAK